MPQTSQKNAPLSAAGADLGLVGNTPAMDAETEEEKKRRLALMRKQQMSGSMGMVASVLGLDGGGTGG